MVTNIATIKSVIAQNRNNLNDKYNVKNIGIFGSVASGKNTETSDVDMLVEFSQPIGMFKFIELEEYLSKILGKRVDLATPKALKSTIKDDILHQLIYV